MDVLFVCLGNICRSPMAAGIMRKLYKERGIKGTVESAGTANWNVGQPADSRAILVSREQGVELTSHRARVIQTADFQKYQIIFAMDRENLQVLHKLAPSSAKQKLLLLAGKSDIQDPFKGNEDTFRETYKIIEDCCLKHAGSFKRKT